MHTLEKMKTLVILVLTLGIVGVIANPVSKQTIQSENKNSPQAESSDSQTKHGEVINTPNKGDQEQKKDTLIENLERPNIIDTTKPVDEKVEISIEENIINHGIEDNCENDQTKYSTTEYSETPKIDSDKRDDGNVEIIIEESIVSTIDDSPQPGEFENHSQLPGDFSGEPQLPGFIEDGPPMPDFVEDPQVTGGFTGVQQLPGELTEGPHSPEFASDPQQLGGLAGNPQFPGFVMENLPLPGFIENIPQLPGFIQGGAQIPFSIDGPQQPQELEDDFHIDKDYFREDMDKVEHEIMETAAGFIPTPLVFRRKQKPRRRFATRRHFRRNPYRRHQFLRPYSYYAFYRPSSLRYY